MYRRLLLVVLLVTSVPAGTAIAAPSADAHAATARPVGTTGTTTAATTTGATGGDTVTQAARATDIQRTTRLHLTPKEPGSIQTDVVYDIPTDVTSLTVTLQQNVDVVKTERFRQTGPREYEWTGSGDTATITFDVDANETDDAGRRADRRVSESEATTRRSAPADSESVDPLPMKTADPTPAARTDEETYAFVDTGDWAIVRVPQMATSWKWVGSGQVGISKRTVVAGQGATGGQIAFLGPMTEYSTTVRDQHIRLVVPRAADMREKPTDVLDSVAEASGQLRVGARDPSVLLVAAPTSVRWSVAGLQLGADDAWVKANARLASPDNVWLHEYVHTRQAFKPTEDGQWLVEGSADYYAALLAFEQGHIAFENFQSKLERGGNEPYTSTVLAEPATWTQGAVYMKGALVTGAIDRELRAETDQTRSFQSVFRELNAHDGEVSNDDILAAIAAESNAATRDFAGRYTTTSATPGSWSKQVHSDLFGVIPALMRETVPAGGVTVTGPYRNETVSSEPFLAVGEQLRVNVTVENVGGRAGEYETRFRVGGTVAQTKTGSLVPEETKTVTFTREATEPGTYRILAGNRVLNLTVREPATPTVRSIDVPTTVRSGETFTVRATISNEKQWPGAATIPFVLDGERQFDRIVTLPGRTELTYTATASFEDPGEHTIRVGEKEVTVVVTENEGSDGGTSTDVGNPDFQATPGFGPVGALVAFTVLVGASRLRRRRDH
ncbi:CARDB domain-containing protein [Haloarchaeobius sp. DT45]|uniref:CARDB domain-containing protein n=1 Tax=Haloarchaeobius sp. DT45 TaxID=3446116 RepID=UPI003F6C1A53